MSNQKIRESDIAIIGMSCRFPGAENVDAFWRHLRDGVESISFFTDKEIQQNDPSLRNHPNYVKAGAVLPNIDQFDASFFGYSPREAAMMDPQQRIFLECAWEAFENAGYNPEIYAGLVGVYAGSSLSTYLANNVNKAYLADNAFIEADMLQFQIKQGNDRNYLPTRVSYKLNLKGPSINVQTACSTALVAVHLACQNLLNGECDMALAGGVSIIVPDKGGYLYEEGMIRSPDGHCRAFDAQAAGTLFGNGAGIVLLKLLSEAISDGDQIVAVIKGGAINNDGALKVGFTAPSYERQADVIEEALAVAQVNASTITYVEAHGTGTKLGDPIEIAALTQAFYDSSNEELYREQCAIGSVKSNIGHLDEAAGIAGLIKTALALQHKQIPPSLHFKQPNPQIDFENSPFYVNTELTEWLPYEVPRRAGVSSFGMGGTNCHLVLEEAPIIEHSPEQLERDKHLLALSAKTPQALEQLAQRYTQRARCVDYLVSDAAGDASLANICFTANSGRKHFSHRAAFVAESNEQLREQLEQFLDSGAHGQEVSRNSRIAFLFTGQGSQYVDMGRQLYESQPIFRQTIDRCDEILRPCLSVSLLSVLYPEAGDPSPINETQYTQPALFALEYALYQLWKSWGIEPDVVMGHSVGEYVAACVAGVFSLEDGLKLIAERGRLMQALPRDGSMVSVMASEGRVAALIRPYQGQVAIAAINSPPSVVISGQKEAINAICTTLEAEGVKIKKLNVSHAFHSPLMEPMLADFEQVARQVSYSEPQIKLISNVTGQLANHQACPFKRGITTAAYWVRHVRQPVRFAAGMESLECQGANVFIEIGPKPVLLGMARECLPEHDGTLWLPSLRPKQDDWQQLLSSLRDLYLAGVPVDWVGADLGYTRRRVPLPTYPWQRERHWVEPTRRHQQWGPQTSVAGKPTASRSDVPKHPLLGQRLYLPRTQEIHFQTFIRPDYPIWVADHKIFGNLIIPGVAYCEMALAAGKTLDSAPKHALTKEGLTLAPKAERTFWLEDVVISQALIIPDEGQTVQIVLSPTEESRYFFEIFSLAEEASWMLHAEGSLLVKEQVPEAALIDLAALQAHCSEEVSVDALYREEMERQIDMGPMAQGVKQLWRSPLSFAKSPDAMALAKISLPDPLLFEHDIYQFHPVLLDAGLQMITVSYPEATQGQTYVPVGMEGLRVYGHPSSELWCRAQYRALPPTDQRQTALNDPPKKLIADLHLFDDKGRVVAVMEGVQSVRVRREAMLRTQDAWRNWLYQVVWQPGERVSQTDVTGHWLILADHQVGQEVGHLLRSQGASYTLLFRGEGYEQIDHHSFTLNPAHPEAFQAVLQTLPELQGVVNCWSLENLANRLGSTADLEQGLLNSSASTLHLVQALTALPVPPRLWLVTQGAQAINDYPVRDVLSSAGWGIGKVITLEHPSFACVQVDLDPDATPDLQAEALFKELQSKVTSQLEDQVAFRRQKRYVARLARYPNKVTSEVRFRNDSSYLITGGLGGLGLKVARFLVERGARHLLLVGRSGVKPSAQEELSVLSALGAQITIAQADVSDREQVAQVLNQISPEVPLRGIMHLAGVLDDGVLQQQSWQRFAKVLAPKAVGAWHLHTLTQNRDLDFFVLFSSITSLLGTAGQANYAVANAFLDGLASYRRALGLPALSINWGSWAEVGMSARLGLDERLSQKGEGVIPPAQGLEALAHLIDVQTETSADSFGGSIGVMPIEWPRFLAQHQSMPPYFANFAPALGTQKPSRTFRDELEGTAPQKRLTLLEKHVQEQVAQILGLGPSMYLEPETGFFALGMDSLSSIELRNLLQSSLGCSLPTTLLFDYPTPKALVAYLAQELLPNEELAVRRLPVGQEHEPDEEDEMSSIDEMAQLLAAKLGMEL